jgi:hypothetical protein
LLSYVEGRPVSQMYIYRNIYDHIYIYRESHIFIYIYIYIYVEREREQNCISESI